MTRKTSARIWLAVLAVLVFAWLGFFMWGCETIAPAFEEARQAAVDARESAERAEEYAQASGDPEAIKLAQEAKQKADALDASLAELETKALAWAEAAQTGEFGSAEGAEIGSLGHLINPAVGTITTILGGVLGGWYYRRRAVQIVKAIDAGKAAHPELDEAFSADAARKAISRTMSPRTWKFVEDQRE